MPVHALAITVSAFLLFLVQPLIAKQILPWFGGSAGVWTTCLVFFQVALLAGYAYSDAVTRRLRLRTQAFVHSALLAASVLVLPIVPSDALKAHDARHPVAAILLLLVSTVGLPFFVLSTTGPLVQAWCARAAPSGRVYRLYAASNAASLAALIAYPVLVEPLATTRAQAIGWSVAYVLFAALCATAAWSSVRHEARRAPAQPSSPRVPAERAPVPSTAAHALWFSLAMLGTVLLLSVTAHLTQDVASIPFLWVLPLALYLATFILVFDAPRWYGPRYASLAAVFAVAMMAGVVLQPIAVWYAIPLYGAGLFFACMFCHGELAARRPDPAHLTRFYFMLSAGGAAGGLLVGIAAPLIFRWHVELPLALCAVALLLYALVPGPRRLLGAAAVVLCLFGIAAHTVARRSGVISSSRNFYGTLRVREGASGGTARVVQRQLLHGAILHGSQLADPAHRDQPTAYFGKTSGIGRLFQLARPGSLRVGIVGLGVGTLAAYGAPGDVVRFYELDEEVVRAARSHFTFLRDTPATVEVAIGDARLTLEREPEQRYDVFVVDAFSSDSIPVHLLTSEAFALYRRHLRPGGTLAFHVSNRYLDLAAVVGQLAATGGLTAWHVVDVPPAGSHLLRSNWVLVPDDPALAARLRETGAARPIPVAPGARAWTDDYSNLLGRLAIFSPPERPAPTIARSAER